LDKTLLQRVAAGESAAFEQCLDCYGGLVWALVRRRCGNDAEAEDVVQDIFVELWRKAPAYDPTLGSEATFVALLARRRLIDRHRRQLRRPPPEALAGDLAAPAPADYVALQDEAAHAAEALTRLSPAQQTVLRLALLEGLTYPEISAQTGWPLGTVKTHARRGLIRLREWLHAPAIEAEADR
jgi:RNA polymerase sigma-70 factor (ECF subfamily)